MDAIFFKPFIDGTKHTLKIQCAMDIQPGKPFIKSQQMTVDGCDITSIIGLNSNAFTGTVSLSFPKSVFLQIMTKMFGEEFNEITDELADGAAELLNIIYGQAKVVLNNQGYGLQKALPTVVRGSQIQKFQNTKGPTVVLPFDTTSGKFYMEIVKQ